MITRFLVALLVLASALPAVAQNREDLEDDAALAEGLEAIQRAQTGLKESFAGRARPSCDYRNDAQFCQCLAAICGGDTFADRTGVLHTVYCGACGEGSTCVGDASVNGGAVGSCQTLPVGLNPPQKRKAEALTSVWENETPEIQYGYAEDIGDGRGYTSGRAGFCTGTGDAIVVVQCYDAAKPRNGMRDFMPALVDLEKRFVDSGGRRQSSTAGLEGWIGAWGAAGSDPAFRACQDGVVDAAYYGPSMMSAARKKFRTTLTLAALYDAQIMHGEVGMPALMAAADEKTGAMADPPTISDEKRWLGNFLEARARVMAAAPEWRGNVFRVAVYEKLRRADNLDLTGCIRTDDAAASDYYPGLSDNHGAAFSVCDP